MVLASSGESLRLAPLNPVMPRRHGHRGIPYSELAAVVEHEQELLGFSPAKQDPIADAIAMHVARWVRDGATIQTGLGKIPGAVLRSLTTRRNLRIHSGLIGDAVAELEQAGALAEGCAVTGGVAIGSAPLFRAGCGAAHRL